MSSIATSDLRADGFVPPSPGDFNLPPIGPDKTFEFLGETHYLGVTKPMIQLVIVAGVVFLLFWAASRKRAMVPSRLQYVGEAGYGFVRNSMGRDLIGSQDFQRFTPYLFALFFFILFNNFLGSIPFFQFPTFSRSGLVYSLALLSWAIYNYVGIRKHGFGGYLKLMCVPSGVSPVMYPLLVPLEFMSNILVRPVTLALRLFCNMFAGHMLLILFALGGQYLIVEMSGAYVIPGVLAWLLFAIVTVFELLIQFLQAYVFVLLNAMYIQGSLADEH
ncbi:F0F1 ATP synthase subunit A [Nocardioides sp. AE5]|uniref:F0F1 ATP synthase subunit A n=1 Tax=Nocardioides sp. AE5 TaxID=2962573 RepID=UPI0028829A1E|nr:F0F1 ATP synthase subunit A [Nocardioides sp. AE5]MDT0200993.1 F0F1 ATP synthase subunit A [Nocardioides sp. AE5]